MRRGDIPRFLNQELQERRPLKKPFEAQPHSSSSSVKVEKRPSVDPRTDTLDPDAFSSSEFDPTGGTSRGEKLKENRDDTPWPSLTLTVGLGPMPDGGVLHPFSPQHESWDDLWLELDGCSHFTVNAKRLINKQVSEPIGQRSCERSVHIFHEYEKEHSRISVSSRLEKSFLSGQNRVE